MTFEERIGYGTSRYLELTTGYLDATPDCPGGCETVAKITLPNNRRLINTDLLQYLIDELAERDQLLLDIETTMDGQRDAVSLGYDIECRMAAIKDSKGAKP